MNGGRICRTSIAVTATALIALGASACGGSDGDAAPDPERGRRAAVSNNCASCHGNEGQGGIGPTWIGLAGSEVELSDGSTVVADEAYLVQSIVDPSAQIVPGYNVMMPERQLSDRDLADIVAYIQSLSDQT